MANELKSSIDKVGPRVASMQIETVTILSIFTLRNSDNNLSKLFISNSNIWDRIYSPKVN